MNLSSFSAFALTREEMKNVVGGGCHICSQGGPTGSKYGPSGTCSGNLNKSAVNQLMYELSSYKDGYNYYTVGCYGY